MCKRRTLSKTRGMQRDTWESRHVATALFPIRVTICCRREIARPLNFLLLVAAAASRCMNKDTTVDDFLPLIVNRRGATEQVILIPGSCATCASRSRKT